MAGIVNVRCPTTPMKLWSSVITALIGKFNINYLYFIFLVLYFSICLVFWTLVCLVLWKQLF